MVVAVADPKLSAGAVRGSRVVAFALVVLGLTVLAGCLLDIPALQGGFSSMNANAAVLFVLLGAGVLVADDRGSVRRRRLVALTLIVIAGLTGAQDVFALNLGIDQLLFHALQSDPTQAPGRMALVTACTFASLGLGLLFVGAGQNERARDVFCLGALAMMIFVLCGYAFGAPAMYRITPFGSIELPTAVGLAVGSLGVLTARPERGLLSLFVSGSTAGRAMRRLGPVLVVTPVLLGWLRLAGQLAGYYDTRAGIALFCFGMIVLIFSGAVMVIAKLERSEQTRALLDVRERAAEHFRLALEVNPAAIVIIDRTGRIVLVNAQTEKLFGYSRSELVGTPIERLMPERFRERHIVDRNTYFQQPRARPMGRVSDLMATHKDGRELAVDIEVNPMRTDEGEFALASIVDIGERKRVEAERAALTSELQASNAGLNLALRERETLLQEVNHRVKNNLQVVASLINMTLRRLPDNASRSALEVCQARVLAIALIHEKLYQAKNYAQVEFSDYVRTLAANIFHASGVSPSGITLDLHIERLAFGVDIAIPCGLILNELITNALKHGFREGRHGTIRVELAKVDAENICLAVRDDGPGLPADFDLERSKSLGLQLIATLSRQIDARLEVENQGGAGFVITFPARQ